MGRNSELIRQWTLLRQLAAVRTNTILKLAQDLDVTTRTVRRDLAGQSERYAEKRRPQSSATADSNAMSCACAGDSSASFSERSAKRRSAAGTP